jgi:hypothetical protein
MNFRLRKICPKCIGKYAELENSGPVAPGKFMK